MKEGPPGSVIRSLIPSHRGRPPYPPLGEFMYTTLSWVLPPLLSAIIPAITFNILMNDWTLDTEPPWSWVMVSVIPLASSALLVLQGRWLLTASRTACAILTSCAVIILVFGWWRHTAGRVSLFIALLLVAVVLPAALGVIPFGRFAKATIFWIAHLFGLGFPAALANSVVVMSRAESIAGDRPYCIQYASQTDAFAYEPVRTLFDLSALKMRQRLGTAGFTGTQFTWQDHAILVINDDKFTFFNWSYKQETFLDEVRNRLYYGDPARAHLAPEVFCTPQRHYTKHLPIWQSTPANLIFRFPVVISRFLKRIAHGNAAMDSSATRSSSMRRAPTSTRMTLARTIIGNSTMTSQLPVRRWVTFRPF